MQTPKDKTDDLAEIPPEETESRGAHIEAPNGLDLHPEVPKALRVSKRASIVRQVAMAQPQTVQSSSNPQPTPEEQAFAAAYQREREAEIAPTAIGSSGSQGFGGSWASEPASSPNTGDADLTRIAALTQALKSNNGTNTDAQDFHRAGPSSANEPGDQNNQAEKEVFLAAARNRQKDDYLNSTRTAPLSKYEIEAAWEIPAVLEQSLNSDLPGELKALVTANVYDTATGKYLLIPQGSRLIGRYDSRLSYAQDGVQVIWNRLIFPDGSSVDLDGMVGLDAHGNAGLRDKVDHHYKRVLGFSALTSIFGAAFAISQRTSQSVLAYATPSQAAGQAVGQELSQTGSQMTRRNLNVQPTIKVAAGYKFTVRVNRDILFDAPYEPMQPGPPHAPEENQPWRSSPLSN
ncbi:MAG TPA: TrbI/VirB10 family protein [Bryobacteraceae bacterium]|nr:TrbI/VirB10 family protein [Bryobacteraceae bacterium]